MELIKANKYDILVKAKNSKSEIVIEQDKIIVKVKSIPENNKANLEIVKLFKKQLNLNVKIIKGFKTNKKIIIIL